MFAWFANLRLRWKVLIAPGFLILVLIGVGAYAAQEQKANQVAVNALMAGPVRQAETVADFTDSAWKSQVHLYRLMATAANETDQKKVSLLADIATNALGELTEKLKGLDDPAFDNEKAGAKLGELKTAVTDYVKHAKSVIDMADGDAGAALTLMMGATRNFLTIEKLVEDLTDTSKDVRDRRIAINNAKIEKQQKLLAIIMLAVVIVGCGASLLISRGITRPVVGIAGAIRHMSKGNFDMVLPGLGRKDEIGEIAGAVEALKVTAVEKARHDAEEFTFRQAQQAEEVARQQRAEAEMQSRTAAERAKAAEELLRQQELQAKIQADAAAERQKAAEEQAQVLSLLASGLKSLAQGDLTVVLDDGFSDEYRQIKDDFNAAANCLAETVRAIAESTREVLNAAAELSTSTTDLSQRTEEQAASLEETSASMEEIASIVKNNAENAQHAERSTDTTRKVADRGGQVVSEAINAMARIEESSQRISDIIGVIDEIARQTNLLALNAAVEAARAGEAGRGFAVVATEVRSLAQRSSQAAKDIKGLITNSNDQVRDGVDLVNKAGTALNEIVGSIKKVAEIVSDIATSSTEQSIGIEQVNKALLQMDELTQQNSALVEENAATAKTLEQQTKAVEERVAYFQLDQTVKPAAFTRSVLPPMPVTRVAAGRA